MWDVHTHLQLDEFNADRDTVLERAKNKGIEGLFIVGIDEITSIKALELSKSLNKLKLYPTFGIHPLSCDKFNNSFLQKIKENKENIIGIGEIGLDNKYPHPLQEYVFRKHIEVGIKLDLPLIVHSRAALSKVISVLKEMGAKRVLLHAFSGNSRELQDAVESGFFVSFSGNITYNKKLQEVIKGGISFDNFMVETDSPFMIPKEIDDTRNQPVYIYKNIEKLAELLNLSVEDIIRISTTNTYILFKVGQEPKPKIVYKIRDSLYINLTNRCSNDCYFCIRKKGYIVKGHYLKLDKEPTPEGVLEQIDKFSSSYKEVVFCGLGEPTLRLKEMLKIAKRLKQKGIKKIRLNTNGHGNIIHNQDITKKLKGLIDEVSVSLQAISEDDYIKICRPTLGNFKFQKIIEFLNCVKRENIALQITCVDTPEVKKEKLKEFADSLGATLRIRKYNKVG